VEDAPTGQLVRQDSPAGSAGTEPGDTDAGEAGTAPWVGTGPESGSRTRGRRTGGRRYKAGRPPLQRRRTYEQPRVQAASFPPGIGAGATLGGLFAWCLASCLLAAWLHLPVVAGVGFCTGCALAAWYCRPAALLRMVIAVPAVFAAAETLAQLAIVQGGHRRLALPVAGGTLLTLAAIAPWLFAGTAGAVTIALFRGLPRCVRDLRAELRGQAPEQRAPRAQPAPRAQRAPPAREAPRG